MNERVYKFGPSCVVHACTKPVRELGHLCSDHWRALSPEQRAGLQWEDDATQVTTEFDSREVARRVAELDAELESLPTFTGERRRWAA